MSSAIVTLAELDEMDFARLGRISCGDDGMKVRYQLERREEYVKASHCVYLWTIPQPALTDELRVMYVGSTGNNIYHRRSTWQSGLNAGHRKRLKAKLEGLAEPEIVGRGAWMRRNILSASSAEGEISVWVRISEFKRVFDQIVPIAKVEEDALIQKFSQEWNWHGQNKAFSPA